jgi:hypothetical protein
MKQNGVRTDYRRRLLVLMAGLAVILLAVLAALPADPLQAAYNRVQPGISVAELEGIFGRPADGADARVHEWQHGRCVAMVFVEGGAVVGKVLGIENPGAIEGFFRQLLGWTVIEGISLDG